MIRSQLRSVSERHGPLFRSIEPSSYASPPDGDRTVARVSDVPIMPHVANSGTPYRRKWRAILLENRRRLAAGQLLLNVVGKERLDDAAAPPKLLVRNNTLITPTPKEERA